MGLKEWRNARSRSIKLGHNFMPSNDTKSKPGWQKLWTKLKTEKWKNFGSSTIAPLTAASAASYDQKTYSKNFDRGMGWMEPDNLSRSFSARFADPSRALHNHRNLLD